jgi:hypothetical protein
VDNNIHALADDVEVRVGYQYGNLDESICD